MINQENKDTIISKFLAGEASPEEAMWLNDWMEEDAENRLYVESCIHAFDAAFGTDLSVEPDAEAAWKKIMPLQETKIISLNRNKTILRIAASVLLLVTLGFVARYFLMPAKTTDVLYVADSVLKTVKLQDGTDISIDPHSTVHLNENFGKTNRTVRLQGSGYFSVTHSEELPFIVDAGDVYIKDIGTKFSIRNSLDTDTVYVRVDEGIVLLFDSLGSEIEIRASEKALYIKSKKQIVKDPAAGANQNHFSFVNTSLQELVGILNEHFNTQISLENQGLKKCAITSQFNNESLETIISVVTETLGLHYEKTARGYIIKGKSCNP